MDFKCPDCGALPSDGVGVWDGGSTMCNKCKTVYHQCKGEGGRTVRSTTGGGPACCEDCRDINKWAYP